VALAVAGAGAVALVAFFDARDDAQVVQAGGPGERVRDLCAAHEDRPFEPSSRPPTSGPHRPAAVRRDARAIGDDALLHALELGNVVLAYPGARPPAALRAIQDELSGPFDAQLAAAGQAVILARRADASRPIALAWAHTEDGGREAMRAFADHWLGQGYAVARGDGCPG
jgi:hypothetical protein